MVVRFSSAATRSRRARSVSRFPPQTPPGPPQGGGSNVSLFQPKSGKTLSNVFADLQEEFGETTAAKGTRDLVRDATFFGLAGVSKGFPEVVTTYLQPGIYYLVDLANPPTGGPPTVATLTVGSDRTSFEQDSDLHSQVSVQATSADRFIAPSSWPSRGTYTFTNTSDSIHFMTMMPVKPGTTDAQVQAAFSAPPSAQNGPPPFALMGPSGGNDVVSPGRSLQVSYNLPPGTYVLLCFVADDKTGMPHAVMGMHKVIVLTDSGTATHVASMPASGAPHTGEPGAVNPLNGLVGLGLIGASGALAIRSRRKAVINPA